MLNISIYQWKVSVVAFVISILSFLKHLFSSPPLSSRTPPHFLLHARSYALVIQHWLCISSSSSSAFFSAALCLLLWLVRWLRGPTDLCVCVRACVSVRVPPWTSVTSHHLIFDLTAGRQSSAHARVRSSTS